MAGRLSHDALRLRAIRAGLAAIDPGQWTNVRDASGYFLEARGPMGELLPICRFDPGASPEEMAFVTDAPETVRFLLSLLDRAMAAIRGPASRGRSGQRGEPQGKDYAAEAAMKCQEPAFLVFLEQSHGLERPLTQERAAQKLRSLCGVTSRRELNDGGQAAARWRALRDDYQAWKRGQR